MSKREGFFHQNNMKEIDKMVENAHYMCGYANYIKKRDAIIGS